MRKLTLAFLAAAAAAQPAYAEAGDWQVRLRGILVAPNEKSGDILPAFPGQKVQVGNSFMPEVDVTFFVSDNVSLELIAATTKHEIAGVTGATGSIGKLASTWVLPPTLTVQYRPLPGGKVHPYVGAGINWSLFYSENASNGLEAAVGKTNVHLSSSWGVAAQAGVDIDLNERMFLNFDVKWIDMDTKARLTTTAAGVQRVKVGIDPLVFGAGLGIRF
jgi:outer membrane protein